MLSDIVFIGELLNIPSCIKVIIEDKESIEVFVPLRTSAITTILLPDSFRSSMLSADFLIGLTNPFNMKLDIDSKNWVNCGIAFFMSSTAEPVKNPLLVIGTIEDIIMSTTGLILFKSSDI